MAGEVLRKTTIIKWDWFNPFLFIRGLSCPRCIKDLLSLNCLKLTIPEFSYLVLTLAFSKNTRFSIGLEIRPQSAFSAFRALMLSANYSAKWSGWVWQPSADSNGLLAHHYWQQRAVTPGPESLNSNKKAAKRTLLSAEGCRTRLDGQHCPLITYQGIVFKGGETLWWYKYPFIFDE